jgi:hypothetical protein
MAIPQRRPFRPTPARPIGGIVRTEPTEIDWRRFWRTGTKDMPASDDAYRGGVLAPVAGKAVRGYVNKPPSVGQTMAAMDAIFQFLALKPFFPNLAGEPDKVDAAAQVAVWWASLIYEDEIVAEALERLRRRWTQRREIRG